MPSSLPRQRRRSRPLYSLSLSVAALAVVAAAPLATATTVTSAGAKDSAVTRRGVMTDHVLVISIDGLRPDAIAKYNAKTILRLMREGSYSLSAQTIFPSKTLPSHTSMLTGVDADQHGITWNSDQTDDHGHVDVPTVFGLAKNAGFRTAAFFSKPKFHHLEAPNTLHHVRSPKGGLLDSHWSAERTVAYARDHIRKAPIAPNLTFVHIGEPDYAGHIFGWMTPFYGHAVRTADEAVADILSAADERFGRGQYSVILTADHGGHDRGHGSSDPRDTTIPWITWGEGVTAGAELPAGIRTMDTAATALWLLGVTMPAEWVGKAVAGAFEAAALGAR